MNYKIPNTSYSMPSKSMYLQGADGNIVFRSFDEDDPFNYKAKDAKEIVDSYLNDNGKPTYDNPSKGTQTYQGKGSSNENVTATDIKKAVSEGVTQGMSLSGGNSTSTVNPLSLESLTSKLTENQNTFNQDFLKYLKERDAVEETNKRTDLGEAQKNDDYEAQRQSNQLDANVKRQQQATQSQANIARQDDDPLSQANFSKGTDRLNASFQANTDRRSNQISQYNAVMAEQTARRQNQSFQREMEQRSADRKNFSESANRAFQAGQAQADRQLQSEQSDKARKNSLVQRQFDLQDQATNFARQKELMGLEHQYAKELANINYNRQMQSYILQNVGNAGSYRYW